MPQLEINGINVSFPFEPYDCQISYMSKVLQACKDRKHAILESPTGTGKTLCLLCATLAWQEEILANVQLSRLDCTGEGGSSIKQDQKVKNWINQLKSSVSQFDDLTSVPKIIFSSRTHAQLSQAIQALKKTNYANRTVGIIGSRDQLCINTEVLSADSSSGKVYQCRARINSKTCEFYNNYENMKTKFNNSSMGDTIIDIEDLVKLGKKNKCCPYFMSRELKTNADIIFMPYNYLLDRKIRRLYNIDLQNAVIIFDEAHNIEQVCEEASSVEVSTISLAGAIEEMRCLGEEMYETMLENENQDPSDCENVSKLNLEAILKLKDCLIVLEEQIDKLEVPPNGLTKNGDFIFELFKKSGISLSKDTNFLDLIDESLVYMAKSKVNKLKKAKYIAKVQDFFKTVLLTCEDDPNYIKTSNICNRVHILIEGVTGANVPAKPQTKVSWDDANFPATGRDKQNKILNYWCFSPGRAMSELLRHNVRSIILTSGTLYPITSLKTELDMKFDIELKNSHVIQKDQVHVAVITTGPDGFNLNSNYANRQNSAYYLSLGRTICNVLTIIPRGVLVFFPSYTLMKMCIDYWQSHDVYYKIVQLKEIILEPRDKLLFSEVVTDYQKKVYERGAVLFAVARGKASEGLDLSDDCGRGVIIIGMPFPPALDPKIKLKMAYLDERKCGITGNMWYKQQAWKAINQSVGRVIRHHKDYGAVLLCDERFASSDAQTNLPIWLQHSTKVYQKFEGVVSGLGKFFKEVELKYPCGTNFISRPSSSASLSFSVFGQSTKTPLSTTNPKDKVKAVKRLMEELPPSGFVETFSPSLKRRAVSEEQCIEDYRSANNEPNSALQESTNAGFLSILDSINESNRNSDPNYSARNYTTDKQKSQYADIARRLKNASIKAGRIRVSRNDSKSASGDIKAGAYLTKVRELLKEDIRKYEESVRSYKVSGDIEVFFDQMARLFMPREAPGLIKDLYDFIRPVDQNKFQSLCYKLTGLQCKLLPEEEKNIPNLSTSENENSASSNCSSTSDTIICGACHKNPPICPLAAPCKHVCCFPCWKNIIEKGNRRCPNCKTMTRRRDLVKLTTSK